jgi:hypothetical protein
MEAGGEGSPVELYELSAGNVARKECSVFREGSTGARISACGLPTYYACDRAWLAVAAGDPLRLELDAVVTPLRYWTEGCGANRARQTKR